uniref:Uncharacterized protein n=1 Tax=Caenorhabditis japonica TaxID=281687 RepID=A0A8R1HXK0_CAEJA
MYNDPLDDMENENSNLQNPIEYAEESNDDDEFLPGERPRQLGGNLPEEQLLEQTSIRTTPSDEAKGSKKQEDADEDDEPPLEPTPLGNAIDSLMMHWCQLLTNVSVKAPVPPPSTLDHVKEVAEVCSKHFRDASVDVSNEFTRLGVQWELEQAHDQFILEDANLDEAIARQERLLESAKEVLTRRANIFNSEFPMAGKHFTT